MKPWHCNLRHCRKQDGTWQSGERDLYGTVVARNGRIDYKARCEQCGTKSGAIPYSTWQQWQQAGATIAWAEVQDSGTICAVIGCESTEVEIHHFAPQALFGFDVAATWPTAPLCQQHHREWHRVMRGGTA